MEEIKNLQDRVATLEELVRDMVPVLKASAIGFNELAKLNCQLCGIIIEQSSREVGKMANSPDYPKTIKLECAVEQTQAMAADLLAQIQAITRRLETPPAG